MRNRFTLQRHLVIAALSCLLSAGSASSASRTFGFSGSVVSVSGTGLDGSIQVGTPFSGTLTFDPDAADSDPDPARGSYGGSGAPYAFSVALGSYVFTTDPPHLGLVVLDGFAGGGDSYIPDGDPLSGSGPTIITDGFFDISLEDSTGTVFSSDSLPTSPALVDPGTVSWDGNTFLLFAQDAGGTLTVTGTVTSIAEPPIIPTLSTWGLVGFGTLLLAASLLAVHRRSARRPSAA